MRKILLAFLLFFPTISLATDIGSVLGWLGEALARALLFVAGVFFLVPLFLIIFIFTLISLVGAWFGEMLFHLALGFSLRAFSQEIYEPLYSIWTAFRDFSLWFIGVFLAFIGFATIFRIQTYTMERRLVPLIFVALLINFLPWFCKTIINIGNSLTVYFYSLASSSQGAKYFVNTDSLIATISSLMWAFVDYFRGLLSWTPDEDFRQKIITALVGLIATGVFWAFATIVFFALAITFFWRTIYLWILFVISPIAFVTLPFATPEMKQVFRKELNWEGWLQKFLEWTFIGVPIMIFVYLAASFQNIAKDALGRLPQELRQDLMRLQTTIGETTVNWWGDVFSPSLAFLPALLAMYMGVKASGGMVEALAQGATGMAKSLAIGFVTTGLTMGAGLLGAATRAVSSRLTGLAERGGRIGAAAQRAQRIAKRMEEGWGKAKAWGVRWGETLGVKPWTEKVLKTIPGIKEYEEAKKEEMERKLKAYEKMSSRELQGFLTSRSAVLLSREEIKKMLEVLAERGDLTEAIAERYFKDKTIGEIQRLYGTKTWKEGTLRQPHLFVKRVRPDVGMVPIGGQDIVYKHIPKDILNYKPDALENTEIVASFGADHATTLLKRGSDKQKQAFLLKGFANTLEETGRKVGVTVAVSGLKSYEELRNALITQRREIKEIIDRLRKSERLEDQKQAEMIEQTVKAIYKRIGI